MQSSINPSFGTVPAETSFIDTLRQSFYGRIFLAISATVAVAVCAHVSLPLPYTPVPLVLSDFAVLLAGMVLGPVAGFWAMVLYLAEGAAGAPVFSPQGPGGLLQLMGHTGGYLFAYPIAAAFAGLTGGLARRGMTAFTAAVLTGIAAIAAILGCGAAWLNHLGFGSTSTLNFSIWNVAVAPFLFGSLAKIVAAAVVFSSTRRWLCPASR